MASLREGMQVVDVVGIPTHVYCRRAQQTLTATRVSSSSLVMVIPGSPGMAHFYIPFVDRLFELCDGRSQVCVVGQAGHSPGVAKEADSLGRDWYSLEDQIAHKIAFLREYAVGKNAVYLIGHSIGCYMILHMLDQLPEDVVKKAILLFPTIERMSETPNGQQQTPLFTTFRTMFVFVVWLLSFIPAFIQTYILHRVFCKSPSNQRHNFVRAIMNIGSPGSIYNILCMAQQEMQEVGALPVDIVRHHLSKLVFYYGVGDQWTLPHFCSDLQRLFPEGDITLCPHGYAHAFVLLASVPVAEFCFMKFND